jgi:hypothetical protein
VTFTLVTLGSLAFLERIRSVSATFRPYLTIGSVLIIVALGNTKNTVSKVGKILNN